MDEIKRQQFIKERYGFDDLIGIVKQLRAPDGCPWDREQTHESMRSCMIEECYEVIEAVNNRDIPNLREELGDVLLQVLLHTAISQEWGEFTLDDVVDELAHKLVRRHPHVFGEMGQAKTSQEGLSRWEAIKKQEKEGKPITTKGELSQIPISLPPVIRAQKVVKKATKLYGYNSQEENLKEEIIDLVRALDDNNSGKVGEIILKTIDLAEKKGENAENSLTKAIETFIKDNEGLRERN